MKILITNHHLDNYAGTEWFTYYLARELRKKGNEVAVFSFELGKMAKKISDLGVKVTNDFKTLLDQDFDLIHAQHNSTAVLARAYFPDMPIIFMSHGPLPELEQPPAQEVVISKYIVVSEEIRDKFIEKYQLDSAQIEIVRNMVDTDYFVSNIPVNPVLKKVLVISNYKPPEVLQRVKTACEKMAVEFTHIGLPDNPQNDTIKYINQADLVITLGRGALEAMACERNVLIYDLHGADGLVTEDNFFSIRQKNFSGRTLALKYSEENLIEEFKKYKPETGVKLRKLIIKENSLEVVVSQIISIYQSVCADKKITNSPIQRELQYLANHYEQTLVLDRICKDLRVQYDRLEKICEEKQGIIRRSEQEITNLEAEILQQKQVCNDLCNSTSWKITHPLRATVDTLKKIKRHGSRITQDGKKGVDILRKKGLKEFTKKLIDYSKNSTQGGTAIQNNFDSRYAQLTIKKQFQNNPCESETLSKQPKISILMPVYNTDEIYLRKAIFSVINQCYRNWELCIIDDCSTKKIIKPILHEMADFDKRIKIIKSDKNQGISRATNHVAEIASGEYLLLLDHDDELTENALFEVVNILQKDDFDFIYSDDDKINENGILFDPQFKPDWSPELLLSYCYISHLKVFKKEIWEKLGGLRPEYDGAQDYDLCLRLSRITDKVAHIPQVLYHWRSLPGSTARSSADKPLSVERGRLAVESCSKEENIKAEVTIPAFAEKNKLGIYEFKYNSVDYAEPVTIIIPTKDKIDYLRRCIDSIKAKTNYSNYQILVINNNSEQASTVEYLKRNNIEYFDFKTNSFNFAQINNEAVKRVESDLILFLNNDTEVIDADWLLNMVGAMSLNKKIGAVGARLVFPDKRTQHAGVVMGLNNQTAGHAFKLLPYQDSGYLSYNLVMRNYSAVTAACLLTRKSIFDQIGGLDEKNFAVGYNDVDYCLKLIDSGYRIVYQPQSILFHHEGGTRREIKMAEDNPQEVKTLQEKWDKYIQNDPYYNPNLSLANEFFQIKY